MEQPQVQKKGQRMFYVTIAIAVAAVLLFSVLAAFFYWQAEDYRQAKYKAQYVLVEDILDTIPLAFENITDTVDDDLDNGWRRSAAMTSSALAHELSSTCYAIQVMYPADEQENVVFGNLASAFTLLSQATYEAYVELSSEVGPLEEHDLSATTDADLRASLVSLDAIAAEVLTGVDPAVDWTTDPYSLLDGMDLEALDAAALTLSGLFV